MATTKYLEKIESENGAYTFTFPLGLYEWESVGALRLPRTTLMGAGYAYDFLVERVALEEVARETVRAMIDETTVALAEAKAQDMGGKILLAGRCKAFTLASDGTRRWAWVRLASMPRITVTYQRSQVGRLPYVLDFDRYSPWFSSSPTVVTEAVTASGETWTVNNPGNLPARILTIQLKANTAAGIVNPKVENQTNGYTIETARDSASANDEIMLDTEKGTLRLSTNDGVSYTDDFAQIVLPTVHPVLAFQLEPGNNTLRYTGGGTPSLDVVTTFYAPWSR